MGSIHFEHLVYGKFMPKGLKYMPPHDGESNDFNFIGQNEEVMLPDGNHFTIRLSSNKALLSGGLVWQLDELQCDAEGKYVWGMLHITASIHDVYDCKVVINDR